jgi:hypothetical protein
MIPVALLLAASAAGAPPAGWRCVESGRYAVYTNAGLAVAQDALRALDGIAAAWPALPVGGPLPGTPLSVIVFRTEPEFRPYAAGATTAGVFQTGDGRDWLAVFGSGAAMRRALRHEFVHEALDQAGFRPPRWLDEGLAEYYSTLERRGANAIIGSPIEHHRVRLAQPSWLPPAEFFPAAEAEITRSPDHIALYYAQCWAVASLLAGEPRYAARLRDLLHALSRGDPTDAALTSVLGLTARALLDQAQGRFALGARPFSISLAPAPPPAPPRETPLTAAQAAQILDDFARARGIDLRHAENAAAQASFEHALALRDTGQPIAEVLAAMRRAVDLDPLRFMYWETYARTLAQAGQTTDALQAAGRARATARTLQERAMAEGLMIDLAPRPQPPPRPAPPHPPSEPARQTLDGLFTRLDCEPATPHFVIEAGNRTWIFAAPADSSVELRPAGAAERTLSCGPQPPGLRVRAEYLPVPAPAGTAGTLLSLEFR